jgi:adenosylmethionine---8-amino-7-oxononanoate aminotransferase
VSQPDILALDRAHLWHPYSSLPPPQPPLLVQASSGVRLHLADGRELIDGMSSWWAAIHGYAHPVLDAALQEQAKRMSHVMFGGLTHEPAARLAGRLVDITPPGLRHVFFTDSGSVAVEVAIKMCLQYWRARGNPDKHRLLTWRGGYHGDTFHAMSVCDPDTGMHRLWTGLLPQQVFADTPPAGFDSDPDPGYLDQLAKLMDRHSADLAAVIVEPVVQGAGGMRFHSPAYLTSLRELADEHGVLLIFDEIATGFGRSGTLFAADHAGVAPDVMCVGKALTGGYLSMGATLCTAEVAEVISGGDPPVFAHGPTFMANPLAAAVAKASVDLLLNQDWAGEVHRIEAGLHRGLEPARELPGVVDVRIMGAIGVVQLERPVDMVAATNAAIGSGVWLRPFADLVYTMPPYITSDADVAAIAAAVVAAVQASATAR